MESLKESIATMSKMFTDKMTEFQQDLQKTASPLTTATLAADFSTFKSFMLSALSTLQKQVEFLARELDRQEMRRRRKMILLHGVPDEKDEDTTSVVTSVIAEHLLLPNFSTSSIKSSYRLGRLSDKKARPIVVKFCDVSMRDKVWFAKTKFKGTGITQSEFLTKNRHEVFTEARSRFGVNKCWTRDGYIHIIASDDTRHRVESLSELNGIQESTPSVKSSTQNKTVEAKTDKVTVPRMKRVLRK